ncbi:hypothetical protein [Arthrobacter psychrochitiniphilus]
MVSDFETEDLSDLLDGEFLAQITWISARPSAEGPGTVVACLSGDIV